MKITQDGINLIKEFEGLRLDAYLCPAGVLTIGYGHTGPNVKPGMRITESEAETLLRRDLENFKPSVERLLKVTLNPNQFSAIVAFAYNLGTGALSRSALLNKLNRKDFHGAGQEFLRWDKAKGKVLTGLTRRRKAEKALFEKPVTTEDQMKKLIERAYIRFTPTMERLK